MAIEVRCIEHLSSEQRQSLNLLYGPLMGKNSICLYEFLGSIQNLVELEDVYLLLNMNASQFDIARNRLEQYHLIETYVHEGDMLILLYAPLLPDSFLCHETYSRLYLASVGAKCFDKVKAMLYKDKTVSSSYTKVESPLDVSILDSWNESKEIAFEKVKPTIKQKYDFDFQKKFGQNFLIDERVLEKIISAAEVNKDDFVLEIGPGIGTMTQYLAENAREVMAVEIDKNLIPILSDTLSAYDNVSILNADILKVDIAKIVEEKKLTTIMVTHNLRYAVEYGNRLLMMHQGGVVMDLKGKEKEELQVEDILSKFNEISIECGN